ncbi:hypothetical protein [Hoeflea sp. TYP-13]|uniref:hypothetical protein n=1 Tax=Hoeflea sp. TYP-13 TaxID=3230023 RepID=UPI0034C6D572
MTGLQNSENPSRAGFAWRAFAKAVRDHRAKDSRGLRAVVPEIGVTVTDLSRAMGGTHIEPQKVIAICDWMERDIRDFYVPPDHISRAGCFTFTPVKQVENTRQSKGCQS